MIRSQQPLFDELSMERDELIRLVKNNGLNCDETVKQSQKLDALIYNYQISKKEKNQHEPSKPLTRF